MMLEVTKTLDHTYVVEVLVAGSTALTLTRMLISEVMKILGDISRFRNRR
jgi:hypothetical protein